MFWKLAEGEGQVEGQCHDTHHHRTFCSRAFHQGEHREQLVVMTQGLSFTQCRHRFGVIKGFQSVEERVAQVSN